MTVCTSRSLLATLALTSSSRLRAPNPRTWRLLSTAPSSGPNEKLQSQSTNNRQAPPPPPPSAHLSTATRRSLLTSDHRSSAPLEQLDTESSQTSPSSSSQEERRPLLQPYELSQRLIALCERGDVDLAVTSLQKAPRNAQNIKVWNTIIQQCMRAKKYKLARSVFTDMKRRGFVPNLRTYATVMSGYAAIDDWTPLTMQLEFVHSVYGQLRQYLERSCDLIDGPANESNASLIQYPIVLYISILGKAGMYQKAFDVFHELDSSGPLAPHPKIYSTLLTSLAKHLDSTDQGAKVIAKLVSDAKYIWRRQMRSLDRQPEQDVEARAIEAMVKLLSRGNPSDHELMFDILRDFCGLPKPSDGRHPSLPPQEKNVVLTTWIVNEVLNGCLEADRPEIVVHYAQSVMDTTKLRLNFRAWNLNKLIRAHILLAKKGSASPSRAENVATWLEWMVAQNPPREYRDNIPSQQTISLALELCNLCKDMPSALRICRAMILDDSQGPIGTHMRSSPASLYLPVKAWKYLFHLATMEAASQDEKRRCLQLFNSYGFPILNVWKSKEFLPIEKAAHISLALHIIEVLKPILPSSDHEGAGADEAWSDIRRRAESFLKTTSHNRHRQMS